MNKALKILITGAAGQLGREMVDACARRNIHFIAFTSSQLDITNPAAVLAEMQRQQPTHIINAAAYTAVEKAEQEPEKAFAVNCDGVKNLAWAAKCINAKLIHISTDYVFDGEKTEAYVVGDLPHPVSVYGASKLAGEQAIQAVFDGFYPNYFILRVGWLFGRYGNNFVKTMLTLAQTRHEVLVVNDQFGSPSPASLVAACLLSDEVLYQYSGIEHFESNPCVSWFEFAQLIFKEADLNVVLRGITSNEYSLSVKRPAYAKLNSQRDLLKCEWHKSCSELIVRFCSLGKE